MENDFLVYLQVGKKTVISSFEDADVAADAVNVFKGLMQQGGSKEFMEVSLSVRIYDCQYVIPAFTYTVPAKQDPEIEQLLTEEIEIEREHRRKMRT